MMSLSPMGPAAPKMFPTLIGMKQPHVLISFPYYLASMFNCILMLRPLGMVSQPHCAWKPELYSFIYTSWLSTFLAPRMHTMQL